MVVRPSKVRLSALLLLLQAHIVAAAPAADRKPAASTAQTGYSIISGTVFRDSGLALPGATVTVEPATGETGRHKAKKFTTVTSPRGEFTVRVPPAAAQYKVTVSAKGFGSSEKIVETHGGEERIEATFSLSPQSK